jgi:hypothetical protein
LPTFLVELLLKRKNYEILHPPTLNNVKRRWGEYFIRESEGTL